MKMTLNTSWEYKRSSLNRLIEVVWILIFSNFVLQNSIIANTKKEAIPLSKYFAKNKCGIRLWEWRHLSWLILDISDDSSNLVCLKRPFFGSCIKNRLMRLYKAIKIWWYRVHIIWTIWYVCRDSCNLWEDSHYVNHMACIMSDIIPESAMNFLSPTSILL